MTTYSIPGLKVIRDASDTIIEIQNITLDLTVLEGNSPDISYTLTPGGAMDGLFPEVDISAPGVWFAQTSDGFDARGLDAFIGQIQRGADTTYLLNFTNNMSGFNSDNYIFVLGGAELPIPTTPAEMTALEASITGGGAITSGPFAPGMSLNASSLPNVTMTENDLIFGTSGNDTLNTGAGEDDIQAGAGDDLINPGDNPGQGIYGDYVNPGEGNDTIVLSDMENGYAHINHFGLSQGITYNVNGQTNTANADKGVNGTTEIRDIRNPLEADGLGLVGTEHDDIYNFTNSDYGWAQLRGGAGNDTYNIGASGGTTRLDLIGAPNGAVVDLSTGIISNDGHGGQDTITGDGRVDELRGTDYNDRITGSDMDESFILRRGNDTLDGGAGFDRLRYDRSRVEAVTVDLEAGSATGVWRGETFNHTISNIENVRGSREGSDNLAGANGVNAYLDGRGGDDTLTGRSGNDTLDGSYGDDSLDGGDGNDTALFSVSSDDFTVTKDGAVYTIVSDNGTDQVTNVEEFVFSGTTLSAAQMDARAGVAPSPDTPVNETGTAGDDTLTGGNANDRLVGGDGNDELNGGDGADTLNGGEGADTILGGESSEDLRDVIYAGGGGDSVDAGAGNDQVFGQGGNDTIAGGAGVDDLQGQDGDDVITGSNFSDLVFGGAGNDFVNGGFGSDRINGGSGADKFFHVGVRGHGSDWLQDYTSAEGDVLLWGGGAASADDFQVNFAHTENAAGERAGEDDIEEGFVIYKPSGQILWALVDGGGQDEINIQIGSEVFDLLA